MAPSPQTPQTSRGSQGRRRPAMSPETSPKSLPTKRNSESASERYLSPPSFAADSPEGEINRTYADINLLLGTIDDHISVLHSEMGSRARKNKTPEYRRVEAHLESQKYPTPKSSIGSSSSGGSGSGGLRRRSTISLTTKRTQLWAAQVRNAEFAELMRRDQYFHELMDDLSGISQWWEINRMEWLGRKTDTVALERALDGLAGQIKRLKSELRERNLTESKRRVKFGERNRLNKQYQYQRNQLEHQLAWFLQTTKLMKAVKSRFRGLKLEAVPSQSGPRKQSNAQQIPFSYTGEQLRSSRPYSGSYIPSWWKNDSPTWWLENAIQDLENRDEEIQKKIEEQSQQIEECSNLISFKSIDIRQIEEEADRWERPVVNRIAEIYNLGDRAHAAVKREMEDLIRQQAEYNKKTSAKLQKETDIIHVLYDKRKLLEEEVDHLGKQLERNKAIWQLTNDEANHSSSLLKRRKQDGRRLSVQYLMDVEHIHDICCIQNFRHRLIVHLEEFVHHEDFPYKEKLATISLLSDHQAHYHDFHQRLHNLVAFDFDSSAARGYELEIVTSSLTEEWYAFEEIVTRAEEVLENAQARSNFPPDTFWPGTPQPGITSNTDMLVSDALEFLAQPDNRGLAPQKSLLDTIHDFFVSPDIAPNFLNVSKIPFQKFVDLVDNLVNEDFSFTPRELQSFLLFCNECVELFSLKGDLITAIDSGWGLLDETLISPLPRQKIFVAPQGNDVFESFLLRNEDNIFPRPDVQDLYVSREIEEDELVRRIMAYCPYSLSAEDIQNLLAYYSHMGKYFRYLNNEVSDNSAPLLHKIDSGWEESLEQSQVNYRQLWTDYTTLPQFIDEIYKVITSPKIAHLIRNAQRQGYNLRTEEALYEFLEEHLYIGGGWLGLKPKDKVSKYRFHLFLRWCHDYDQLFSLKKPNKVKIIRDGWE